MTTILTAQQAKLARESLRLSQGKVSSELGINRTYLSLFESGKYIFDEQTLDEMLLYYEGLGYHFEAELLDDNLTATSYPLSASQAENSGRLSDGGLDVVSTELSEDRCTALLAEYDANRRVIDDLAAREIDTGLFAGWFDEPGEEEKLRLVTLMARNYAIQAELKGEISFVAWMQDDKITVGNIALDFISNSV